MSPDSPQADLKAIWHRQPVSPTQIAPEQLRKKALAFQRKIWFRNAREYVAAAIVIFVFGYRAIHFQGPLLRIGSALTVLATLFIVYYLHRHGAAQSVPPEASAEDCLAFHRKQLERNRDLLRSAWLWYLAPFLPGLTIFLIGRAVEHPPGRWASMPVTIIFCTVIFVGAGLLNRWVARRLQRQIDALNAESK